MWSRVATCIETVASGDFMESWMCWAPWERVPLFVEYLVRKEDPERSRDMPTVTQLGALGIGMGI